MIKKIIAATLSTVIGVVLIVLVLAWINFDEVIKSFKQFTLENLTIFLIISVLIFILHVWRWQLLIKAYGYSISFWRILRYKLEGYAACYLTPGAFIGGEPLRAVLLKVKHNIPYPEAISSIIIDKTFEILINGFLAGIGIILLLTKFALPKQFEIIVAVSVISVFLLLGWFYHQILKGKNILQRTFRFFRLHKFTKLIPLEQKIVETEKMVEIFFRHHKKIFVLCLVTMPLFWVLIYFEYRYALLLIGVHPTLTLIFLVFAMVGVSFIAPVPAGLGVLETTQASIFSLYGHPASAGVALSFLIRGRDLVWVFFGVIGVGIHGIKRFYRMLTGQ